jgi:hypothetical protein
MTAIDVVSMVLALLTAVLMAPVLNELDARYRNGRKR